MNYLSRIHRALTLPNFDWRAAQVKMGIGGRVMDRPKDLPGNGRRSAIMMLLYPRDGELNVAYTLRPTSMRDHSGQVSFPGGKIERDETAREAALRELHEELCVSADALQIVGELSRLYIPPSDFYVRPFVGWAASRPNFIPDPTEVAALIEAPLAQLIDPTTRRTEKRRFPTFGNIEREVPYFAVGGHKIWGATALMTGEFLERWKSVGSEQ